MRRPRLNKNFLLLAQAQFVSQLGDQLSVVATLFWLKETTKSATALGLLGAAGTIPALILSPVAGALVDRYSRRALLIGGDLLRGAAYALLAALAFFRPGDVTMIVGTLFVLAVLSSVVGSFFEPALAAILPDVVPEEELGRANSVSLTLTRVAGLVGPGIAGFAFRFILLPVLFLIDALSYVYAAVTESFARIPKLAPRAPEAGSGFLRTLRSDTAQGLRHIWGFRGLRTLLLSVGGMNFLITPLLILLPFYVEDTLKAGVEWYGFLLTSFGIGSLAGYLVVASIRFSPPARARALIGSLFGIALAIGVLALVPKAAVAVAVMFCLGCLAGLFNVSVRTILQLSTPPELRGRTFGVVGTMTRMLSPLAMALAGMAADLTGQNVPAVYLISSGSLVVATLVISFNREFRSFLRYEPAPPVPAAAPAVAAAEPVQPTEG